jgi:hypothetical protein
MAEDNSTEFTTQYHWKLRPEVTRIWRKANETRSKVSEILFHLQEIELSESAADFYYNLWGFGCPSTQVNSVWWG